MRLFVAVNFDAVLRSRLYDAAAPLREAAPDVAWVPAERLHTTLKFLGEHDASLVPRLATALRALATVWSPCDVSLHGYGAFPNFRRPHVVWIGGDPAEPLIAYAAAIDDACAALGLARETRPFRTHVTLGRVKRPLSRRETLQLERIALARHEAFPWHVGSVDIMHSVTGRSGPTYTVLESIGLGATP
ncbi:MAG: RNA 2',3'-cyclic phosphodiesterase [Gemmatimonadaceae bacterium]